jgi:hypothetical protein
VDTASQTQYNQENNAVTQQAVAQPTAAQPTVTQPIAVQSAVPQPTAAQSTVTQSEQLPRLNVGALLMPGVWGPAHGQWVTILFYPLWLFCDISFTNAIFYDGLATVLAVFVFLGTAALTVFFALTVNQRAYLRVAKKKTVEQYLRRERVWIVVSAALAILLLILATWYNLVIRIPAGPEVV